MAHVFLHRDYIPRVVLSRQFDIGHRSNVVRRVAEESRRRRGGRRGSDQGGLSVGIIRQSVSQTLGYEYIIFLNRSRYFVVSCSRNSNKCNNVI